MLHNDSLHYFCYWDDKIRENTIGGTYRTRTVDDTLYLSLCGWEDIKIVLRENDADCIRLTYDRNQ